VSSLLWGKVYYREFFAGIISEEQNERIVFTYDRDYVNANHPPLSHTLPLRLEPYVSNGLPPFFDNLVAEGWLEGVQTKLLSKETARRFELLLAFGHDCHGAVSVICPEQVNLNKEMVDEQDPKEIALLVGRASLAGAQPKLALVLREGIYYPAKLGEVSTHIAKFAPVKHGDLITNEYLTTLAFKALLPEDDVVESVLGHVEGINEPALIVKRFDRDEQGNRVHFEEFAQLLGLSARGKYSGVFRDMADFIHQTKSCDASDVYKLYQRILAGILLGNTDMHFKNFALFHTPHGLRLTPSYDQVAALLYHYNTVALASFLRQEVKINSLRKKHIISMGEEFALPTSAINEAIEHVASNIKQAQETIKRSHYGMQAAKEKLIAMMDLQWQRTFA
jgi:serine/threonine-protein kinase HipA